MTQQQENFWAACMKADLKEIKNILEDVNFNVNISKDGKHLFNEICSMAINHNNYLSVFKLLVKRPELNINFANLSNQLPLISACEKMMNVDLPQSSLMFNQLLARPDINPNKLCPVVDEETLYDELAYYKSKGAIPVQYMSPYYYSCVMDEFDEKKCSLKLLKHPNFDFGFDSIACYFCEMSDELFDNIDVESFQTNMFVACDSGNLQDISFMIDKGIVPEKEDIDVLWQTIMWMMGDEETDYEYAQDIYNKALKAYFENEQTQKN